MIPEYQKLRMSLQSYFDRYLRERLQEHLGPLFRDMRKSRQVEGDRWSLHCGDTQPEPTEFEEMATQMSMPFAELGKLSVQQVREKLDGSAEEFAGVMARRFFAKMDASAQEHGNVYNAEGRPFSPEMIIELISGMDVAFRHGAPQFQLVVSPNMEERARKAWNDLLQDPEAKGRLDAVIQSKYEAWCASETDRSLDG